MSAINVDRPTPLPVEFEAAGQAGDMVDMGYDLLTPTTSIIAYTEVLLEFAEKDLDLQEFIPDIQKMQIAGQQLSTLIIQLFSKKNTSSGEVDREMFTSKIRHDLRTPINAIIGYGEMLMEDINATTQSDIYTDIQKILTSARRLLTQIGDLTYFNSTENNNSENEANKNAAIVEENCLPLKEIVERTAPSEITQDAYLLVIDDKESNRDLLSRRLDRQGFKVEVAENGIQALQMMRSKHYDLALLDIIMPEMNGYQVLAEMKMDAQLCDIPVLMISALDEIDSVVRCIEMGAEDFLQKPFNQVILKAKISASLERKRLRDRERAFMQELQFEQEKSEKLLLNILPQPIAERLMRGERTIVDSFPEVTVLFSDLVGFTELSAQLPPTELIETLNDIFLAFDILAELHGLEKIKTIGDAYMLVGGVPTLRDDHAEAVADMAIDMFDAIGRINQQKSSQLKIRVGIHTGSVIAGVIGKNKFNYDLWGDAVNIASRMESQGIPGEIQISQETYERIKHKFVFERRGPIEVKGKGEMVTYLLKRRR